jgi:myosin heavy subunit
MLSHIQKSNVSSDAKSKVKSTVASVFHRQIGDLVNTLDATRGSFIRCIKPNAAMAVGVFDNQYVVDQLRCQGIMQTCEVLKAGLPTLVGYDEVLGMVRPHLPQQILNSLNSIATAAAVQNVDPMAVAAVFWAFELEPLSFKLGLTRAFFKTGQLGAMEKVLRVDWAVEGQRICNRVKLWIVRRRWRSACFKVVPQNAFLFILLEGRKRDAATALLQSPWRVFSPKASV